MSIAPVDTNTSTGANFVRRPTQTAQAQPVSDRDGKRHSTKGQNKGKYKKQKINPKTGLAYSKEERQLLDKKSKQTRERRKQNNTMAKQAKTREC